MHLALQLAKSKETGVKMFPTKTSRDVGMVDGVSDATGSSMKKYFELKTRGAPQLKLLAVLNCRNPLNATHIYTAVAHIHR